MHERMKLIAAAAALALAAPVGVATAQQDDEPSERTPHGVEQTGDRPEDRPRTADDSDRRAQDQRAQERQRASDDSDRRTQDREPAPGDSDQRAQAQDRRQASGDSDRRAQDRRQSLTRTQRTRVQRELAQRGLYDGRIDGIHGPMTRGAIEELQRAHGLDATGEIDRRTARVMGLDVYGEQQPVSGTRDDNQVDRRQGDANREGRASNDGSSRARITDRGEHVRNLQRALQERGHLDEGADDGLLGPTTQTAIRDFQRESGIPVTGNADEQTMRQLGVEPSTSEARPNRRTRSDSMGTANQPTQGARSGDDASDNDSERFDDPSDDFDDSDDSMRAPTADPR